MEWYGLQISVSGCGPLTGFCEHGFEALRMPGIFLAAGHRHLLADCVENVGASTYNNPTGIPGLLQR
jgi:hypothetical protein